MMFWLIALAIVVSLAVVLFVVKRVVSAYRRSCGLDAFWAANKRRSRVVVTVYDDDMPCGVDALNVEGVVKSVTVEYGELTVLMLGCPSAKFGVNSVSRFSFNMNDVQYFSVGERQMLRRLEWRECEGLAYALRFTGGNGSMSVDDAVARVKERGGSCWGVEEAAECERLLEERCPR